MGLLRQIPRDGLGCLGGWYARRKCLKSPPRPWQVWKFVPPEGATAPF